MLEFTNALKKKNRQHQLQLTLRKSASAKFWEAMKNREEEDEEK